MNSRDPNFLLSGGSGDFDGAEFREGLVILRDLVALGKVGVEIVFSRENRSLVDAAAQRHSSERGKLNGAAIQNRHRTGQSQTHRAYVGVWLRAEGSRAGAENLARGQKLHVHLQPDYWLVAGEHSVCEA